jgi:hypothetical protein
MWALPGASYTPDAGIMIIGGQGQVTIPSPSFLIEHDRGLVLFDTGRTPDAIGDPVKIFGALAEEVDMVFEESDRLDLQIAAVGFRPEQVTPGHVRAAEHRGPGRRPRLRPGTAGQLRAAVDCGSGALGSGPRRPSRPGPGVHPPGREISAVRLDPTAPLIAPSPAHRSPAVRTESPRSTEGRR